MIHREGYKLIALFFFLLALINGIVLYFGAPCWISYLLLILSLGFWGLIIQFFRNPGRKTVINPNHVIAPADGKVVVIEEVEEPEYFKDKRKQVSIFMSPLNVHVNRYPVGGTVEYVKYHPGLYLVAWHPKSST
jgi:phosphatidylserine decarboxylase